MGVWDGIEGRVEIDEEGEVPAEEREGFVPMAAAVLGFVAVVEEVQEGVEVGEGCEVGGGEAGFER